jgi:hypothetical protein
MPSCSARRRLNRVHRARPGYVGVVAGVELAEEQRPARRLAPRGDLGESGAGTLRLWGGFPVVPRYGPEARTPRRPAIGVTTAARAQGSGEIAARS